MTALLAWKEDFETGIPDVDYEHRTLVASINELFGRIARNAAIDEIAAALSEIHALIEAHFALEEKIMRDMAYPHYRLHKADHDRLLEDIREIMENVSAQTGFAFGDALADRVGHWFGDHFRTMDRTLHTAVPSRRS